MGLAWRIVVVVLLGLLVAQGVQLALFWEERRSGGGELVRLTTRQIVAATELYEALPPAERPRLLAAVAHPLLRVEVSDELAFLERRGWQPAPRPLAALVRARLAALGDRDVVVNVRAGWRAHRLDQPERAARREPPADPGADGRRRWLGGEEVEPSRQRVAVSVPLVAGGYLTFLTVADATSLTWAVRTGVLWVLTAIVVLTFAWWASRRIARPFQRFAAAADRLGLDVHAPPLPDAGSGELRQAVRAFNRMQERIRRMVDDRTMMLAAISHDLKTMLTRLRLRAELIDDAEQRQKAVADLDEMQTMLEGALAFARDEAQAEPAQALDLARLVQALVDDAADAGHAVTYDGPERLTYVGRAVGLRRLVGNLLDNARRYAGAAEVSLVEGPERLLLRVGDRGPGVPEGELERLLEPFFRLERSRSRATGGAGLGLAIVRSIARAHGGDVTLANRPGGGLEVTVTLAKLPTGAAA